MGETLGREYMAGLMDADGHFSWRGGRYQCPNIGVTNTSEVLMDALKSTLGGSVGRQRLPCPTRCRETHIHRRMVILKWSLTGYRSVIVIRAVEPFLIVKRDLALSLVDQYDRATLAMQRPARREHHMAKEREAMAGLGWD